MPRLDGTGPRGQGSRTGRGMGNCSGMGGAGQGFGLGRGTGRGFGRFCLGCPFCGNQEVTKEDRKKILLEEKELIEKELSNLESDK